MRASQVFVGVLIAIALLFTIASLVDSTDSGDFGFKAGYNHGAPYAESVSPGSPAAKAGLRAGTPVYVEGGLGARVTAYSPRPGERLTVHVSRPDGPVLTLVAVQSPATPLGLIAIVLLTRFAFLLIAGVVVWRRAQDPAARALAVFLAAFGAALSSDFDIASDPNVRFMLFLLTETLFALGAAAVLAFACAFPPAAPGSARERLARTVPLVALAGFALVWSRLLGTFAFGDIGAVRPLLIAYVVWYAGVVLLSLAAFIGSYRTATGPQRVRMWWILMTFGAGFSGLILLLVVYAMGFSPQWVQYCSLTVLLIPVGLGYTILRHRVLDIGFVVNRAVVYTGVSFVVVGSFIAFEWLLGHLVERGSNTSIALQLGAALALGVSV
ncbi:MAG TPA: hypothetical protein VNG31_02670, partial [Candidatus Baltobacteraceae bacterium]|nr:hypothetical protein [Candidatus Baltobacteraceae bacterium]